MNDKFVPVMLTNIRNLFSKREDNQDADKKVFRKTK